MKRAIIILSLLCLWPAGLAAQEAAEAEGNVPVLLLPGDPSGERFGVRVRRGPAIEPTASAPEDVDAEEAGEDKDPAPPEPPPTRWVRRGY